MKYCDLCMSYTNSIAAYRHPEGGLYYLCDECVEMVRDGEPIDDETDNEEETTLLLNEE